jgi:hypothetical protein
MHVERHKNEALGYIKFSMRLLSWCKVSLEPYKLPYKMNIIK